GVGRGGRGWRGGGGGVWDGGGRGRPGLTTATLGASRLPPPGSPHARRQKLTAPSAAAGRFLQFPIGDRRCNRTRVARKVHWPPTEKSWLHFRPPPVDFCGSRLAIGAATERARALAMPAGTRAQALQTRL